MYASLYPSIILENNIAPNTQIGRIIIEDPDDPNKTFSLNEHTDMYETDEADVKYVRGGEFVDNLISGNILEFCWRWLGLGDIYSVLDDISEFYKYNKQYGPPLNGQNLAMYETKSFSTEAITFSPNTDYNNNRNAVYFSNKLSSNKKEEFKEAIRLGALL